MVVWLDGGWVDGWMGDGGTLTYNHPPADLPARTSPFPPLSVIRLLDVSPTAFLPVLLFTQHSREQRAE